jgi:hypothetical protein
LITPRITATTSVWCSGGCRKLCSGWNSSERVAELLFDVGGQRLADLLGADAVEVGRGSEVAHHRLDLHPVGLGQQRDDLFAGPGAIAAENPLVEAVGLHLRPPPVT